MSKFSKLKMNVSSEKGLQMEGMMSPMMRGSVAFFIVVIALTIFFEYAGDDLLNLLKLLQSK